MKRVLKWVGVIILTPVLLFIFLAVLLYLPPVQNWAVRQVAAYASEQTGMKISVDHVRLAFPLDLSVEGMRAVKTDTVADIERLIVDIRLLPLLRKQVEIDELTVSNMRLNTVDLIPEARVRGTVGRLFLESHGIDLSKETLRVNMAKLSDARLDIALSDTVPPDTSESENRWKIYVDRLAIQRTDVTLHLPGDTLQVGAYLGAFEAKDGTFDLGESLYKVGRLDWTDGKLTYDNRYEKPVGGLDYNHLVLTDVRLGVDSLHYHDPKLDFNLRQCSFKEKSGLQVDELKGQLTLNNGRLYLPDVTLKTPESNMTASLVMDLNSFDELNPGELNATVHGSFGKQDLLRFMGDLPVEFRKQYPNYPLQVDGAVKGNMNQMSFTGLNVKLPTAFNVRVSGFVANLNDSKRLRADLDIDAQTQNLSFVTALLDPSLRRQVSIPSGIGVKGNVKANGTLYAANLVATEGGGSIKVDGTFDSDRMAYQAMVKARQFPLQHFLPKQGLSPLTAEIDAKGVGTDFLSSKTSMTAKARISRLSYGGYTLDGMTADATVRNGHIHAVVDSQNELLNGLVTLDALTNTKDLRATVTADLRHADLYHLNILHEPFDVALCGHVDVTTDLKDNYQVRGTVSDVVVVNRGETFRPEDITLDVLTRRDTTHANVDCGDFHLRVDAQGGYEQLLRTGDNIVAEVQKQLKERTIDQFRLRQQLPLASVRLTSGKGNFIVRMMNRMGYGIKYVNMDMTSSPVGGLNGSLHVDSLIVDSILLDTIHFAFNSDEERMRYSAKIRNNKRNPQYVFNALFDGELMETGTNLSVRLYDAKDKLGVGLGVAASMEEHGLRFRSYGMEPVLGYKTFAVNDDNYIYLSDDRRVSADVVLRASDGMGVQIYTNDANTEALQDITFSLNKFDLEKVLSVIPYTPDVKGVMNGDFHVIQTTEELSVSSNLSVDKMYYERNPMGNVATEFVYMPKSDGSHYVDGFIMQDGKEVCTINGTYQSEGAGYLDATLGLNRTPLSWLNGFIPDKIIGLRGYGEGALTVKGSLSKPQVNGEVYLDSSYIYSEPYGVEMRFANDPVRIVGSHLLFENFEMFANNDSPLNVAGSLDFSDLDHMTMDVRMRAQNFLLIDAKENPRSEAYGKAYVNFFGMMRGPLESLQMRGKLDVLGTTDMSYILRDSPLTTDKQLEELVKFTDFNDTTQTVVARPALTGFDMDLTVSVDEGAHIMAYLNTDHSNYVDLMGGGTLRMQYNPTDELRLTGRYTLNNGEMKYALPIIPLKTFTIQDGSYIEFTGDPMNPTLNITATEQTKATVTGTGVNRSVAFDCGVVITKTLSDMGLEFIIDAPEDTQIHSELQTMTKEQRGKLAVSMLTTGMYLADGNTGNFSMNSALSSFLNSEINQLTGNALRTLDLSFGLDNSTDASGTTHTDYSFKFAKRLWNNRLKIAVGGKVTTGSDVTNQNQSFFDNVTLEYRLNNNSNKYIKLFYDNNVYDWLEGYTQEYGAGFIWRRSLSHFNELFRFKSDKQEMPPPAPKDTVTTRSNASERKGQD